MKEVHEKIKKFQCESCDKMFSRRWVFKVHFQSKHGESNLETCNICKVSVKNLPNHISHMHINTELTKCYICGLHVKYLKMHIRKVHAFAAN